MGPDLIVVAVDLFSHGLELLLAAQLLLNDFGSAVVAFSRWPQSLVLRCEGVADYVFTPPACNYKYILYIIYEQRAYRYI